MASSCLSSSTSNATSRWGFNTFKWFIYIYKYNGFPPLHCFYLRIIFTWIIHSFILLNSISSFFHVYLLFSFVFIGPMFHYIEKHVVTLLVSIAHAWIYKNISSQALNHNFPFVQNPFNRKIKNCIPPFFSPAHQCVRSPAVVLGGCRGDAVRAGFRLRWATGHCPHPSSLLHLSLHGSGHQLPPLPGLTATAHTRGRPQPLPC